ncbi:hypothetical protein CHS0354_034269 [Potamilus streckersoni]|uniref:Alpha/beta hydrolase fold-3 domain-containing protein n=1 Tax=Potamilus streckersoni TaxID=2493646 RepID=A0AAE0S4I4_9BIVA|nr:hypothetical protein CHS0354_034269 [Potamilus streckersoni]
MASREELGIAYSPSRFSHRYGPEEVVKLHVKTVTEGSKIAKETVEHEEGVVYGLSNNERLDIFAAQTLPGEAPIFVFIHGGYWQELGREMSSFMVPPIASAGAVCITVGYNLAPQASMDEIVTQIWHAMVYIISLAKRRGSSGIYLCGHSAGAHLAALMLAVDWMAECMSSNSLIKGAVLVSGIYDLRPLVNTYINDLIGMTEEDAWKNSPTQYLPKIIQSSQNRKILVTFAEHDPPSFKEQSQQFYQVLAAGGVNASLTVVPDTDHFSVIENFQQDSYILTMECRRLMGLNVDFVVQEMEKTGIT